MTRHLIYKRLLPFVKHLARLSIVTKDSHQLYLPISKHPFLNKNHHEKPCACTRSVPLLTLKKQPFEATEAKATVAQKSEVGWKPDCMSH